MRFRREIFRTIVHPSLLIALLFAAVAGPTPALAQGWSGYGGGPQHQALSKVASQFPQTIVWSTTVDVNWGDRFRLPELSLRQPGHHAAEHGDRAGEGRGRWIQHASAPRLRRHLALAA